MRDAPWFGLLIAVVIGCNASEADPTGTAPDGAAVTGDTTAEVAVEATPPEPPTPVDPATVPDYLEGFGDLYVREGDEIVDAPEAIEAVARRYPLFPGKGAPDGGVSLTILASHETVKVGEELVVVHVLEATEPGVELYLMGPKRIHEEYVDGTLASAPWKGIGVYDGAVLTGPGVDGNYDLTRYTWTEPGTHTIQWRHGGTTCAIAGVRPVSNTLTITVVE